LKIPLCVQKHKGNSPAYVGKYIWGIEMCWKCLLFLYEVHYRKFPSHIAWSCKIHHIYRNIAPILIMVKETYYSVILLRNSLLFFCSSEFPFLHHTIDPK
jgi:hypothetical protein